MKFTKSFFIFVTLFLGLGFSQTSRRTTYRFAGANAPGNLLQSGYGDVYVRTSDLTIYVCTKLVGSCNGTASGNWKLLSNSSGTPGGSNTQIQYNDNGVFGGVNSTGTGNILRESAILGLGSGNAWKFSRQNSAGTDTEWWPLVRMAPVTAFNSGLDLIAGGCAYRDTVDGGYFESISIESTDGSTAFVSGSATFTVAATTDGTTYSVLGTTSLSSASRAIETVFSGWSSRQVGAGSNSRVRICLTSVGSGMKALTFSPRFR